MNASDGLVNIFIEACSRGVLNELKSIHAKHFQQWQSMLAAQDCKGFIWACECGRLSVLEFLHKNSTPEQWQSMLAAKDCYGFRWACDNDSKEVANFLAPDVANSPHNINWGKYNGWLKEAKNAFENSSLSLPPDKEIPDVGARHFAAVGAKLALLKKEFPAAELGTMLGELPRQPKAANRSWTIPWQRINENSSNVSHADVGAIIDTVREVSRYTACYVLRSDDNVLRSDDNYDNLRGMTQEQLQELLEPIQQTIAVQMINGKTLAQLKNLSDIWHNRRATILSNIRAFAEEGAWRTLLVDGTKEILCTKEGLNHYRLINLTTSKELDQEHELMGHCVDGYVGKCQDERFQVFSLQKLDDDKNWQPVTTIGCKVENGKLIPPEVNNHTGKNNRPATPEERSVADWFIGEVNTGRIRADFSCLGKIPKTAERCAFENMVGVGINDLTPELVNKNFQAMSIRSDKHDFFNGAKSFAELKALQNIGNHAINPSPHKAVKDK